MLRGPGCLAITVALASMVASGPARAQAAEGDGAAEAKATAEVLFHEGRALLGQNKLAEACPKLKESLRLDTGLGTMLYLAECWERSGRTASAWAQFREAQAVASRTRDPREKMARARADKLEPKLARIAVVVPAGADLPDLVITRDGAPLGRASWGIDAPVDSGKHVLRAVAPGHLPWEATVDVTEPGARERVVVPPLADEPKASVAVVPRTDAGEANVSRSAAAAAGTAARAPDASAARGLPTPRILALGVAGVGVIGVGLGAFFGLRASSTLGDADARCDDRFCTADGLSLRDEAKSQAMVSTIAFAAGGVALAGAAALWFTASTSTSAPRARPGASRFGAPRVAVVPGLREGGASIAVLGSF